ncbi:pilus assembly protein PilQ [Alkalilimnicola ehrlichii]|uniref:Pilus assembly protein PilQ n=1 Tax=Alkalilimnicola ehrlichii TaxID=351052 RepID=A0A3E0X2D1_9GAMM|nr:pilus assembly protein PilQ [Alkalilimnicola ehrlichii]RFA39647.1 pilus assembly protein PilQ [Alkalilimnicola ehrlichii]
MILLLIGFGSSHASANSLTGIDYTTLSGNAVQVTFTLAEPIDAPEPFLVENPARIAFDLPDTRNALSERGLRIGVGAVEGVSTAEAGGRTRVVIRLAQMVPYDISAEGNEIQLVMQPPRSQGGSSTAERQRTAARAGDGITDIDFRRGPDGTGRVILELADPNIPVDLRAEGDRVVANLLNTRIPQRLERRLDVTDFATPVQTIDTRQRGDNVRVVISNAGNFDHMSYQSGSRLTIEVQPITEEERAQRAEQEYSGDRLSLNFQDIEVRAVLQLIADFTGLNVVVSDSVGGSMTLRLQDVPWDQALDIILQSRGLDKRQTGNVMLIGPAEEIAARERQQLESQQQIRTLAPLRAEFMQVNYAKASDIASLIRSGETSLLSERGSVTLDERTNTLIVRDTESNLTDIRNLIAQLDVPVRQVLIESRIVIANDDFTRDLGVRFGYTRSGDVGSDHTGTIGGTRGSNIGLGAGDFNVPGGLLVDMPVEGQRGSIGVAVGRIGTELLQLELSAMEVEGRGDIVSSPRVITANQQQASIEQGVEIPYEQATASGATSIAFQKAVLGLEVTPQITPDDRVLLDLHVSKDSPGANTPAGPAINTQSVTTQVLVDNGETVVLGGIYERTNTEGVRRIPFFGELPLVGSLFRSTSRVDNRSELLIFVTPKLLSESLSVNQ